MRLTPNEWTELPGRPSKSEQKCTGFSLDFWRVSPGTDGVRVQRAISAAHVEDLPFPFPVGPAKSNRYVRRLPDGWVVGLDSGEFGGGLWWCDERGKNEYQISPPPDAPAAFGDPFRAENVLGLPRIGQSVLVLMGLDHLTGRSGRIFRLSRGDSRWVVTPVGVLESAPNVWAVDGSSLLIVNDTGLSRWEEGGAIEPYWVSGFDLGTFAPVSLAKGADGAFYLGLRHYILKLEWKDLAWKETWFARSNCLRTRKVGLSECECVP